MRLLFSATQLFIILIVFLGYFSAKAQVRAQKGIFDLRGESLENQTFVLEGEFEFYWQELISPEAFANHPPYPANYSPFPHIWTEEVIGNDTISAEGYGTYRFRILLPPNFNKKELLQVGVADIYTSYQLFINGQKIASNGIVAKTKSEYKPYWLPTVSNFLAFSDTIEVVLQIANFDHSKGGSREPLNFGKAPLASNTQQNFLYSDFILFGCVLMGGLFFLGLYFFSRNEISLLWFSLFCITYSYRFIGAKNYGLHHLFSSIPWKITVRLEYALIYLSAFIFVQYTYALYKEVISKLIMQLFSGALLLLFAIVILTPPSIFTQTLNPFFILVGLYLPVTLTIYIKAIQKKLDGAKFALLSISMVFFSFSYDILAYLGFFEKNIDLIFFSYFVFFFLQSLILSYRFAKSFERALQVAEKASMAKMNFLSTMSHEIRTPLNAIVGMSNLLKVPASETENLDALRYASKHLMLLINDILDYSKIDAGKIEFDYVITDLNDLLKKLLAIYQEKAAERHDQLILELDENLPPQIYCDPTRLNQILSNLISNAIKFTEHGKVLISVKEIDRDEKTVSVKFLIADTGIGIPLDKQSSIFENFSQASTSTTRKFGGTGLGLTITQKLLELQGVEILLESEEGKGSKFFFVQNFEFTEVSVQKVEQKDFLYQPADDLLAGKRILLVEDNPMNVLVATKFLQKWNIDYEVAESGVVALSKYNNHELVLMDLEMPDMDGFATTENLRKKGVNVPIIALTASVLLEVKERVMKAGMDDFVTKPFDPKELYDKMVSHLKGEIS